MTAQHIDETASVSENSKIGDGVYIWRSSQVRENSVIGNNCIIGMGVYVDRDVMIGNNVKIQNNVSLYHGVTIEDNVFIGPHVCFTNDKNPRATDKNGNLLTDEGWEVSRTRIKKGASIGANSTICPGVTIGKYAMVGAGSVVTKDVEDFTLVYGNPAKAHGIVNESGKIIQKS